MAAGWQAEKFIVCPAFWMGLLVERVMGTQLPCHFPPAERSPCLGRRLEGPGRRLGG